VARLFVITASTMLGFKLSVTNKHIKPVLGPTFWILNDDASQVSGRLYVWDDASTFNDLKTWKDGL